MYWYNMACDIKHTYAIQTLHVHYVQFSGKVGDSGSWQLSLVSHPPSSPFVQRDQAGHRFVGVNVLSKITKCFLNENKRM